MSSTNRQPNSYINRVDVERVVRSDRRTPTGFEVTYRGRTGPSFVVNLDAVGRWENVADIVICYARGSRRFYSKEAGQVVSADRKRVKKS